MALNALNRFFTVFVIPFFYAPSIFLAIYYVFAKCHNKKKKKMNLWQQQQQLFDF